MRKLVVILGIPIDDLDMAETLDRLENFVVTGRADHNGHQVATVNADFLVKAIGDPELRIILQEAHMATADGMPLVWGARLLGAPLKGRVAGSDFVPALFERAANKGFSIFLLGATPTVAARAAQVISEQYPDIKIAGVISPPFSSILEMNPSIIEEIKAAKPDILLVAFGNPKQEKWISMYGSQLQVPVMIGVGGTLDFIAGNLKRAPKWMQQSGMEWLFRLLQEPRRLWRRYVIDLAVFSFFFIRQWIAMTRMGNQKLLIPNADLLVVNDTAIINLQGSLTLSNLQVFQSIADEAISETPFVLINMAKINFLDSSAIGAFVGLARVARDAGGDLFLAGISPEIQNTLSMLRLDQFFICFDDIDTGLAYRQKRAADSQSGNVVSKSRIKGKDWGVIHVPRRLDASTVPEFSNLVTRQLAKNPFLVLDFSETIILASAGLSALLNFNREATKRDGELLVIRCGKDVLRVIELGHVDGFLTVSSDLPSASH